MLHFLSFKSIDTVFISQRYHFSLMILSLYLNGIIFRWHAFNLHTIVTCPCHELAYLILLHKQNLVFRHIRPTRLGSSLVANRIIGYYRMLEREKKGGWDFAHAQDKLNLSILHIFWRRFFAWRSLIVVCCFILCIHKHRVQSNV